MYYLFTNRFPNIIKVVAPICCPLLFYKQIIHSIFKFLMVSIEFEL